MKLFGKAFLVATLLLGIAVTLNAGTVMAQSPSGLPGSGWWTSAGIQNIGTGEASVELTAYRVEGDTGSPASFNNSTTIAQNGNTTFIPESFPGTVQVGLPSGFAGSMVLSSNQPLAAVGQVGNNTVGSLGVADGQASAFYNGSSSGAAKIFYPTIKSNFVNKSTTLFIQAAGADVTIAATLAMNDGTNYTYSNSIAANKTRIISVADFKNGNNSPPTTNCGNANTSPCVGAVTITATGGDIVGSVVEAPTSGTAVEGQAATLFTDTSSNSTIICPVYKSGWFGRTSGITVQNVTGDGGSTTVTFSGQITGDNNSSSQVGQVKTGSADIGDGKSVTFFPSLDNDGLGNPALSNVFMAVTLTTDTNTDKIVAAVNESNFDGNKKKSNTYTCFNPTTATAKVALPQVKDAFGGLKNNTGVSIQYAGTDPAGKTNITAEFNCGGTTYTHNAIEVGGATSGVQLAHTYFAPSNNASNWSGTAMPSAVNCAVTVTSSGANIVGIANESTFNGDLDTKTYEGFNLN
jgi:hypothetical protein